MCDVPFEMAKNEAVGLRCLPFMMHGLNMFQSRGTGGHNLVSDILGDTTTELQEYYLKTAAGSVYAGGAETASQSSITQAQNTHDSLNRPSLLFTFSSWQ